MAETQGPWIDPLVIEDLVDLLGAEAFGDLLDRYCKSIPTYLANIAAALVGDTDKSLQSAAHALKGSALNLGLLPLGQAGKKLEDAVKAEAKPFEPLADEIVAIAARTMESIDAYLRGEAKG